MPILQIKLFNGNYVLCKQFEVIFWRKIITNTAACFTGVPKLKIRQIAVITSLFCEWWRPQCQMTSLDGDRWRWLGGVRYDSPFGGRPTGDTIDERAPQRKEAFQSGGWRINRWIKLKIAINRHGQTRWRRFQMELLNSGSDSIREPDSEATSDKTEWIWRWTVQSHQSHQSSMQY